MLNENHVVEWERNRPFPLPHRFQTRDWWKALRSTLSSDVIQGIGQPVLAVTLFSLAVALLYRFFPALPSLSFKLGALAPHSLVAPALSLLLVFRTNAAYSHFWEGRQRWQELADHCRSLSRYVMLFERQLGRERRCSIARLLCAFPIVLKQHLRGSTAVPHVQLLLSPSDVASLRNAQNQPLHVVNLLSLQLASTPDSADPAASFSSRERLMLLNIVSHLSDCIGACERIVLTPVPLHYARHTSRLASIFVATLPFVLAPHLGLALVPTMAFVAWALLGIQEIGLLIEDPFHSILKLDKICTAIQKDVQQTLDLGRLKESTRPPPRPGNAPRYGERMRDVDISRAADVLRPEVSKGPRTVDQSMDDDEAVACASVDRSSNVRPLDALSDEYGDVIEASVTASRMQC